MQGLWCRECAPEQPAPQLQMVSFTLDPQWCGLLFSVYCRHEKGSLLWGGGLPPLDAFAACSLAGPPLDADWIAFAGSFGFEICRISSTWALIFETVKASGVILLLGVGSLVCYKLYHYYWPRSRSRLNSPSSSPPHTRRPDSYVALCVTDENQLVEDIDDEDASSIEGRYFGPSPVPKNNYTHQTFDVSEFLERSSLSSDQDVPSSSHSESGISGEDDGRDADVSDGSRCEKLSPLQKRLHLQKPGGWRCPRSTTGSLSSLEVKGRCGRQTAANSGWLIKRLKNMLTSSPQDKQLLGSGSMSLPVTPGRKAKSNTGRTKGRRPVPDWGEEWRLVGQASIEWEKPTQCRSSVTRGMPHPNCSQTKPSDEAQSPVRSCIRRDESFDSLGFSMRLPREGSFDSTCSELSLDFSLPEATVNTSTMVCLDNLQEEIDQLKNNCLMMDEEFETIKCNRNLPGMSSLMKVNTDSNNLTNSVNTIPNNEISETLKQENARACFAGLYSLTTIKNSTSSELSDSLNASGNGRSIGSAESLDWDSPKSVASPVRLNFSGVNPAKVNEMQTDSPVCKYKQSSINSTPKLKKELADISTLNCDTTSVLSEDELMANLEWDEEDLAEYPKVNDEGNHIDTLEMDLEMELTLKEGSQSRHLEKTESAHSRSCTISPIERSSKMESSGFESKMVDSTATMASSQLLSDWDQGVNPWAYCSSEESGYMEWDGAVEHSAQYLPVQESTQAKVVWDEETAMAESSSNTSEQSTPLSENPSSELVSPSSEPQTPTTASVENIGCKMNIFEYAVQEWRGQTKKAETILKGYAEIPSTLGLQHLRKIRGDNYCGVRAAVFQTLAQGLPVPSGATTFQCLSHALNSEGCNWLQDWTFAGRLPYQGSNVLHGMETCLRSLDNVTSLLSSSEDREETLAAILNTDHSLDLHIVEAVKLHMLLRAIELHQACTSGADIPLFAMLMFARDTSETPRDLMNNHLREVGNSGGLEQVEMFLLGYTLGVTLRVVRPSAYGTEDFISSYPDWNVGTCPQVALIAEDDRHYNVLVA